MNIPNHVAIILDGNGRWAKAKGMPRNYGHVQGAKTVEQICEDAWNLGIHYLTVYAFSTENWNRPKDEVSALMTLLRNYMKSCLKRACLYLLCQIRHSAADFIPAAVIDRNLKMQTGVVLCRFLQLRNPVFH